MYYDSFDAWWWPYVFIILAGVLPTAIWRWAGVLLVGNIDEDSEAMVFIRCIATALLAALIAQFIFFPNGALATIPLAVRLIASFVGFLSFLASGNRLTIGILAGEACLILGALATGS